MASSPRSQPPVHNILFTIPRTASNLVTRLLNLPNQPSIVPHPKDGYFFIHALTSRYTHKTFDRPFRDLSSSQQRTLSSSFQISLTLWSDLVTQATVRKKGTYIKEHINWTIRPDIESHFLYDKSWSSAHHEGSTFNPTYIPDSFLLNTVRPTLLIRHPALTFPSLMRTAIDNEGFDALLTRASENSMRWEATYYWHVTLYKFYTAHSSYPHASFDASVTYPIILDAADLSSPELVRKYAAAVGLDPEVVRFEWDEAKKEDIAELGKVEKRMKDTLLASRCIRRDKLGGGKALDLGVEKEGWKREFGDVLGERVGKLVNDAMGEYEWLWERRLRI
ncbi:hypothetical protein FB567DRAFT_177029 [Paraphoma chrysanthemicola]|uniref:Uncharacterized protein n=1 Tax=Paraphoma chrysanthemicola TaxID=798071 RepID=A0A8K0W3Q9_9PLEO|nr:hypothetical protein FB567DRAFT_177029 [Paraphoma chrysanthemicola]